MTVSTLLQDTSYGDSKNRQQALDELAQIATSDMSPVNQMFNGRSVFITGASGFIGRVLLEKLLRCYQGIKRVYILMRPKKNMQPQDRLNKQLLKVPIFDRIRAMKNGQELLDKIVIISGDIGLDQFGLSESDMNMMLEDESLSIVFHSAATVKFDEPIETSIKFNLAATDTIIQLCKRLPNLVALCHVSTAYVNSDMKDGETIEETLYPIKQNPQQMIALPKLLDSATIQQIKPALLGDRPNTYTFTKALGEHLIALEASDLPVAIVRPSIVVAAWKEPLPGWVDNLNGPTGLILAIGKGLLRSMHVRRHCKADIIPVDIVINTMIASSYRVALNSGKLTNLSVPPAMLPPVIEEQPIEQEEPHNQEQGETAAVEEDSNVRVPPIFHCTSGDVNPITWGNMEDMFFPIIRKYPSIQVLRYPFGSFKSNKYHDMVTRWFVHFMPALIVDLICMIMGKKRQLVSIYLKLHSAIGALSHFSTTNYNFKSKNFKTLQATLTHPLDKEQLYMDISDLNWYEFWDYYVLGARRYVLKEEDSTLDESRVTFRKALYLEYAFRTLLVALALIFVAPSIIRVAPCVSNMLDGLIRA